MTDDGDRFVEEAVAGMLEAVDPVPPEVLAGAHVAFAMRAVDAELAALVGEVADDEAVGVRGGAVGLTFRAGSVEVLVEVAPAGRTATMTGQVAPPAAGSVTAEWPGGSVSAPVDERGRFAVDGVARGTVRLRVEMPGRQPVVTDWVQV